MFEESLLDLEAAAAGVEPAQRDILVKLADTQRDNYSSAEIRLAAALAKTASEIAGESGGTVHRLYSALLRDPAASDGHRKLASVVFASLGAVSRRQEEVRLKQANPLLTAAKSVRGLLGGLGAVTPEVMGGLAMIGLAGGGVAGGSTWALNRALTGEDEKLRQLELQRDTYGQLSAEVKAELARRKLDPSPANQAAAVDYLT